MLETLLVVLLSTSMEPLGCEDSDEIPPAVIKVLKKEHEKGAVVEIREQTATGYISSLFYNRLYLEGWFFEKDGGIVACEITLVLKLDEEGKVLFLWHRNQKES